MEDIKARYWHKIEPEDYEDQRLVRRFNSALSSLLMESAAEFDERNNKLKCFEAAFLSYADVAGMELEDFVQLGLEQHAAELMRSVKYFPFQKVSYNELCRLRGALFYNNQMLEAAERRVKELQTVLSNTCLSWFKQPPEDVSIEEKYYAGKYVIDALQELGQATQSLKEELSYFTAQEKEKRCTKNRRLLYGTFGLLSTTLVLVLFLRWRR